MNWNIVEGKWKQFRGKVKARWRKLTDINSTLLTAGAPITRANYWKPMPSQKTRQISRSSALQTATTSILEDPPRLKRAAQHCISCSIIAAGKTDAVTKELYSC